jgi:hypothetical protein
MSSTVTGLTSPCRHGIIFNCYNKNYMRSYFPKIHLYARPQDTAMMDLGGVSQNEIELPDKSVKYYKNFKWPLFYDS